MVDFCRADDGVWDERKRTSTNWWPRLTSMPRCSTTFHRASAYFFTPNSTPSEVLNTICASFRLPCCKERRCRQFLAQRWPASVTTVRINNGGLSRHDQWRPIDLDSDFEIFKNLLIIHNHARHLQKHHAIEMRGGVW